MSKDKIIRKDKKKKPSKKLQNKLLRATDKVISEYGDVLKKLGKE